MNRSSKLAPVALWIAVSACGGKHSAYPALTGVAKLENTNRPFDVTDAVASVHQVTQDKVPGARPALAPNGAMLVYELATAADAKTRKTALVAVEPNALTKREVLTSGDASAHAPSFSQDGTVLVYVLDTGAQKTLVRASSVTAGAEAVPLLKAEQTPDVDHPTVSPDGYRVAFEIARGNKRMIAVARLDGQELAVLGEGKSPAWSSDGQHFAFVRKVGPWDQVLVSDATGGSSLIQLTRSAADHRDPAWSPDGSTVVYASNAGWKRLGGSAESTWNLFAARFDGKGKPVMLTKTRFAATTPSWGRDGWIYFACDVSSNRDIWRLKPNGALADAGKPLGGVALVPAAKPHGPGIKREFNVPDEKVDVGHQPMPDAIPEQPTEGAPPAPPPEDDGKE